MRIAMSSSAALCDEHSLARLREVVKQVSGFVIVNGGAYRDSDLHVFAILAMPIAALAVMAASCAKDVIEAKLQKSVLMRVCNEVDVSAIAAVAAARTASRNELLTSKCDRPVSAVARFD